MLCMSTVSVAKHSVERSRFTIHINVTPPIQRTNGFGVFTEDFEMALDFPHGVRCTLF